MTDDLVQPNGSAIHPPHATEIEPEAYGSYLSIPLQLNGKASRTILRTENICLSSVLPYNAFASFASFP